MSLPSFEKDVMLFKSTVFFLKRYRKTLRHSLRATLMSHAFGFGRLPFFHLLEKLEEHVLIAVLSVGKISRVHHAKPCYHIRILLYKLAVFAFGHILHAFTSLHILKRRGRQKGFTQNKKISPHE